MVMMTLMVAMRVALLVAKITQGVIQLKRATMMRPAVAWGLQRSR